jgi:hypothetical protein
MLLFMQGSVCNKDIPDNQISRVANFIRDNKINCIV